MIAVAVLLLAPTAARPAPPPTAANAEARRIQESLVALRAADLVRERRLGTERERRARAQIAQQEQRIRGLLAEVRRGKAEEASLRGQLAELRRQRDQSLIESAAADPDARRELKAFETEVASAVARPQPAIREALRVVAETDGRQGFAELRKAYAATPAADRAASARELATLALPLVERSAVPLGEAIALWEEAMRFNPAYAWGWIELARLQYLAGRSDRAAAAAAKAAATARIPVERLAADNEAARAAEALGDRDGARRLLQRGLILQRNEHERSPADLEIRANLAAQLHTLAEFEHASGRGEAADALLAEAFAMVAQLRRAQPGNSAYRHMDGLTQGLAARQAAEQGRAGDAEAAFQRTLAIFREEVADAPDSWRANRSLGLELTRVAHFAAARGQYDQERAMFAEARTVLEAAIRRETRNQTLRTDLSVVYQGIGSNLSRSRDYRGALVWDRRALQLAREIQREDPGNLFHLRNVALALGSVAAIADMLEDYAEAETLLTEKVAISERLLQGDPRDPRLLADLSAAYAQLGTVRKYRGDRRGARVHLERAVALARQAQSAAPTLLRSRGAVTNALFRLADLTGDRRQWQEVCTILEGAQRAGTLQSWESTILKLAQAECR